MGEVVAFPGGPPRQRPGVLWLPHLPPPPPVSRLLFVLVDVVHSDLGHLLTPSERALIIKAAAAPRLTPIQKNFFRGLLDEFSRRQYEFDKRQWKGMER